MVCWVPIILSHLQSPSYDESLLAYGTLDLPRTIFLDFLQTTLLACLLGATEFFKVEIMKILSFDL